MAKLKSSRMFISPDPTSRSGIFLNIPDMRDYHPEYEVTMRDCNRQIHWLFSANKKGLTKAKKVLDFYTSLVAELEEVVANTKGKRSKQA